jgi:hypothetical protein
MTAPSSNRIPILQMIIAKVRRLTGSADPFQLPDVPDPSNPYSVGITDYINSFYLYDFPSQYRALKLKDKYTFDTIQGQDTYPFDSEHYTTVEQPAYVAKRETLLLFDPWSFYALNFNWQYQDIFAFGTGGVASTTPYSGFTTASPLIASVNNNPTNLNYPVSRVQNVLITANTATSTMNVTDDGFGNLIGDVYLGPVPPTPGGSGTINYQTGEITGLLFNQPVPQGNKIEIQYNPQVLSQPLSILFFQNQFTVRPVPDQGYTVELIAYRQPSQALANTPAFAGSPELSEWWECIAVGAAKKIYEDRLDFDGVQIMDKMLAERYSAAITRTWAQLGKQRIATLFADQLQYNYGSSGGFFGSV